jgi:hypothetical protein
MPVYIAFGQILAKSKAPFRQLESMDLLAIDQGDSWCLVLKESVRSLHEGPQTLGLSTINALMANYHEHFANSVSHTDATKGLFDRPDWIFFREA